MRKINCEKCNNLFTANNFNRHYNSCKGNYKKFICNDVPENLECHYCNKICKNNNSWSNHTRCCPKNPNRKYKNNKIGKKGGNQYTKAKELGLSKPELSLETRLKMSDNSKGKKHSEETKRKISETRKQFIQKDPKNVPYVMNHYSKGSSYPEKYFEGIFDKHNITYIREHKIGYYSLDFTFPYNNIDLEIHGDQHRNDPRIVESDKRRKIFLTERGYEVIEIFWSDYQSLSFDDRKIFISELLDKIAINSSLVAPGEGFEPPSLSASD